MSIRAGQAPELTRCVGCGFWAGERVMMLTEYLRFDGKSAGRIYGSIEELSDVDGTFGCGHIASWDCKATATVLPNPNVKSVYVDMDELTAEWR